MLYNTLGDLKNNMKKWAGIQKYIKFIMKISLKKYKFKVDMVKKQLVQMS